MKHLPIFGGINGKPDFPEKETVKSTRSAKSSLVIKLLILH